MRTKISTCRRKVRFGSLEDAEAAASRSELRLRAYRCDRCGLFHLTGRTKGKPVPRADR